MPTINRPLFDVKATSKATDQQHKRVLADIRNILSQMDEINQPNFRPVKYTDAKGEERPMFNLTKEGCLY